MPRPTKTTGRVRKTKQASVPAVPANTDPSLARFLAALKESFEVREGLRGDTLDRNVTWRELVDGIAPGVTFNVIGGGGGGSGGGGGGGGGGLPVLTTPPAVTGFSAVGSFSAIIYAWDDLHAVYANHSHVEIWRAAVDDLGQAVKVAESSGQILSQSVGNSWSGYSWIRAVNTEGNPGPYQGTAGVYAETALDPGFLLEQLTEDIMSSPLWETLAEGIDRIEGPEGLLESLGEANLETLLFLDQRTDTARANYLEIVNLEVDEDSALAQRFTYLGAELSGVGSEVATVSARLLIEEEARVTADSALAQSVTTLQTELNGNIATVQQHASTIDGLVGQWYVKIDVNGYVTGFGLYSDGATSDFIVRADRFSVAAPGSTGIIPFVVDAVNNRVAMDAAYIKTATITSAQIGLLAVDTARIADGAITTAKIGNLAVDSAKVANILQSSNYVGGASGWRINKAGTIEAHSLLARGTVQSLNYTAGVQGWQVNENGGAEFWNVLARGNIEATSLKVDAANIVSTLMLQNNAVVHPVSVYSESELILNSIDYTEIIAATVTAVGGGQPVIVTPSFVTRTVAWGDFTGPGGTWSYHHAIVWLRIYRVHSVTGTVLIYTGVPVATGLNIEGQSTTQRWQPFCAQIHDFPAAGSVTYRVEGYVTGGGSAAAGHRSLSLIHAKK